MTPTGASLPLAWDVVGSGRPVVLVHGFGASRFTWRRWVPALSREHTTWRIDLKGFGEAPGPRDGRYGPLDQGDLLLEWLRREDIRDATLVGHSLGGGVVLYAALRLRAEEPERLRSLVVVSGAAYPQRIPRYIGLARLPFLPRLGLELIPPRTLMRRVLREITHPDMVVTPDLVEGYAAPLARADTRYAVIQSARQIIPEGLDAVVSRYPSLDLPVLLIWGRQDPVVPVSVGERLASEVPGATLRVLDRCGHLPQEERPGEGLDALLPFLAG